MESKTGPTGVFERLEAPVRDRGRQRMIAEPDQRGNRFRRGWTDRTGLSCMASELGLKGDDGYIGARRDQPW